MTPNRARVAVWPFRTGVGLVAALLVVAGCLSGPSGVGQDEEAASAEAVVGFLPSTPALHVLDASGDATDTGAGDASTMARCAAGQAATGTCLESVAPLPRLGTPGPHYDILGVNLLGETVEDLVVSLEIAKLSEGWPELENPEGVYRMNYYRLCWSAEPGGPCDRGIVLDVLRHGGYAHVEPKFQIGSAACNEWSWCSWGVDMDVEFGEPATLTFTVPKAYVAWDGAPAAVESMRAETGWVSVPREAPAWHPGVTVHTPAYHFHTHGGLVAGANIADTTEPYAVGETLMASDRVPAHPVDAPLVVGHEGANHGDGSSYDHPDLDLLWFDMYEEGSDWVSVFAVKSLAALPEYDFDYSVAFGLGPDVWEIGYRHEGGGYYGYAGRCIMEPCQDGPVMTPPVDVTFGAPGFIEVRTPLAFVGDPSAGEATELFWAMTMYSDVNYYWGDHDDAVYGDYHSVFMVDALVGGAPYVFGSGHGVPPADGGGGG